MRKNIRIITPVVTRGLRKLADVAPFVRPDLTFSHSLLDVGPPSIECEFDSVLSVPDTVRKAIEAEREGASAIVIDCMGDPGLHACREVVSIPVLGPCETSMHLATMLGQRFSVVTVLDSVKPQFFTHAQLYGVADRMASVRAVNIPVLDLDKNGPALIARLGEESEKAVAEDGADVIVLGCTGFCGAADAIQSFLLSRLKVAIPVIDPIPATVLLAASMVDVGLTQSKKTYGTPAKKNNVGYDMPPMLAAGKG